MRWSSLRSFATRSWCGWRWLRGRIAGSASATTGCLLSRSVSIREVGPRDGLQAEAPVSVEARVALIEALASAGLREIEAVAFVSPKAVPSMEGAAEVAGQLPQTGPRYWALVPNLLGAERSLGAGIKDLTVTISASPTYNRRNVNMEIDQSIDAIAAICSLTGIGEVDAVVSCAFGSPYEGDVPPERVAALGDRVVAVGVTRLTYADTTGMGTPRRIGDLVAETGAGIGLHLHETRGTGLVNAWAALELGVNR